MIIGNVYLEICFLGLLGLIFGSFGGALSYRIPRDLPLGLFKKTRSECSHCKNRLRWYHNIPLISYLLLKGKCSFCKKKISCHYFLVELSCSLLFMLTYFIYQYSAYIPRESNLYYIELVKLLYFVWALIVTSAIDLEFRIIPDRFSWGGWVIALSFAIAFGVPYWVDSLIGGLFGFGLFFFMAWFYEKWKGIEGLGMGDVKMMGWLGAWIGIVGTPMIIVIASVSGLVAGLFMMPFSKQGMKTALPFGPFLALGAYVAWILGVLGLN